MLDGSTLLATMILTINVGFIMVIAVPIYFAYSAVRAVTTNLATFFLAMSIGVILILLISVVIGVALMPS